jgi:hypothetical protein
VIDQATVDGRRRLVLIRRDNVEHLLIIGGPTDVVVEQNILRAAAVQAPARPAAASDTLPRAVPLGDDTLWPLQPEPAPKAEPAFKPEPGLKSEPAPRTEPSLRGDGEPRPPRLPTTAEEPAPWPSEPEIPEVPAPPAAAPPPIPSAAPAARRPAALDPLAGLAEELSRLPSATEPPRRGPRLPATPPASPAAPEAAGTGPDQNLSEMAQRLEAALRRPPKPGERPAEPTPPVAPAGPEPDPFAPRPRSARMDSPLRRPFRADDLRSAAPAPRPSGESGSGESEEGAPRFEPGLRRPFKADDLRSGAAAPKPADKPAEEPSTSEAAEGASPADAGAKPKSLYDSLEQEMASLINRPTPKP